MIVDVAVPFRVASSFHYLIDDEQAQALLPGSVVQVPLGKTKTTHGYVLGILDKTDVPLDKLKPITQILIKDPIFDEGMLKFLKWVSDYYCHPLGEVLAAAVPKPNLKLQSRKRITKPRTVEINFDVLGQSPGAPPELTDEQAAAVTAILDEKENRPFLLHGITGSGKTEIYIRVLEKVLEQGRGGIVLVPEIALTPQLLGRFASRFPGMVAVLHSDLTPAERAGQWEKVRLGQARIVVGARSAVFAPVKDLGLIVVDEEQEASFKQEDSLRYHARDLAVVRARMSGAKIILGSATPSLESYANASQGRYCYLQLTRRVLTQQLPRTTFVDIKNAQDWYRPDTPWLSRTLALKIEDALAAKKQTVLYLNRLGFAHFLFCKDCGHTWRCRNCDVSLTYYRHPPGLKCHYCGYDAPVPMSCESCDGTALETLGLGTEQVENQLKAIFPAAKIARMDRGQIRNRKDLETILEQIARREVDIVIGTQMVAKGHDFPGISLVGILVADASLNMPDFRANERTFQIITQVSGRAGRAGDQGEVVIQTVCPEQPVLRWAAENRSAEFYASEMQTRRQFGFPPFQRLAMLRFQHTQEGQVASYAEEVARLIRQQTENRSLRCAIVGPSEAPLAKIKNLFRWQCLLKAESVKDLQILLRILNAYDIGRKSPVQMAVDVDPVNAM